MKKSFLLLGILFFPLATELFAQTPSGENGEHSNQFTQQEYSAMLEESFLVEMNPGTEMAISPQNNEKPSTASKGELIADKSGDYKELFGRGESVIRERTLVDFPGFPKYFDTGNPEMDEVAYKASTEKWALEHPEEFKKITKGQP